MAEAVEGFPYEAALGRAITDYHLIDLPKPHMDGNILRGVVVRIDRFGNVVTNLDRKSCERLADGSGVLQLTVAGRAIGRLVSTFSGTDPPLRVRLMYVAAECTFSNTPPGPMRRYGSPS